MKVSFRFVALLCAVSAASALTAASDDKKKDTATVILTQSFPFRVLWTAGDEMGEIEDKDSAEVPAGKISIAPVSRFQGEYESLFYKYRLNGGKLSTLSTKAWEGTLKKGDKLEVVLVGVAAPAHAALVPYKDGQILVSVIHPIAQTNKEANFDPTDKEEFRSSAMFFAKYGVEKVSKKLAEDTLAAMASFDTNKAKVRNKQQVSVLLPMKGGKVLPDQAQGSEAELAEAIEIAFRTIGRQHLVYGNDATTLNQEIEKAEKKLKE